MQFHSQQTDCVTYYDDVISCEITSISIRFKIQFQKEKTTSILPWFSSQQWHAKYMSYIAQLQSANSHIQDLCYHRRCANMYFTVMHHVVYIFPYMVSFQEISRNSANKNRERTLQQCSLLFAGFRLKSTIW